uniref:Uncharacterized protein n=1 Tax=Glossina morsitans morsitans TaxID=37546 RepID=A0A1B0FGS1_GLOMM
MLPALRCYLAKNKLHIQFHSRAVAYDHLLQRRHLRHHPRECCSDIKTQNIRRYKNALILHRVNGQISCFPKRKLPYP